MNRRHVLTGLSALPVVMRSLAATSSVVREVLLPFHFGGYTFPVLQNGYIACFDRERVTLRLVDANTGAIAATRKIVVPEAAVSMAHAAAVSPQKTLVVAASGKDAEGRYAELLIFSDLSGGNMRVVRTNPFAAAHILFLPDGRLLCIGREFDSQFWDVENHNILRIYSSSGVLQQKALNVNLLRPNGKDRHPLNWKPVLGQDRVGLIDQDQLRYTEFDYNGVILRPLGPLGLDSPIRISGAALLSDGNRLVSTQEAISRGPQDNARYVFKLSGVNGQVVRELVKSIQPPPNGAFWVMGAKDEEVALLSPGDQRLLFVREPIS